ncbi:peptidoglycan DD-metalloendopeptidase family protein [Pseudidiomarina woesei]|uniref:Murein DD-endopeptidase MepM and murein hydrolase activator NlpD, contain LysM domain n=1 Tax=Pseudidiomarina woesei TaxID=1381080 RepID=A0A0K6GW26_9GAMM|nr:peptidoglycan DD-metalloendopeptidase family protein [Pseudidiomarina woesei]CUA82936.1 Murein DD-endopeptidase MepM and murein hydrolase activator NlpD, contain LysM domain [Pseudidiomarina woesei]
MFGRVNFYLIFTTLLTLVLSGCAQPTEPAPVTRLYKGKSIHDFERASLASSQYEVEQGDTLYSIAFRANVDVRDVAKWNQIPAPYTIVPGQKISLQAPATRHTETIASQAKKEYVDKQNKSKAVTVKQQAQSARVVSSPRKPPVINKSSEPALPASKDIRWQWPTPAKVTREFSTAEAGNKGIDFAGSEGDPVYAAASGKVVYAGNALKGYGQLIILKHNDDYITAYAHNQKLLVKEQQWVNKGEEIATMGDTDAERVKLHFQVRFRGKSVNPRHYLPRGTQ